MVDQRVSRIMPGRTNQWTEVGRLFLEVVAVWLRWQYLCRARRQTRAGPVSIFVTVKANSRRSQWGEGGRDWCGDVG